MFDAHTYEKLMAVKHAAIVLIDESLEDGAEDMSSSEKADIEMAMDWLKDISIICKNMAKMHHLHKSDPVVSMPHHTSSYTGSDSFMHRLSDSHKS